MSTTRTKATVSSDQVLSKPKWADGGAVSNFVNLLIKFKPLYGLMRKGARKTLINAAEQRNVPWIERSNYLESKSQLLKTFYNEIINSNIKYPTYYQNPFHAYDTGNLNWLAAYECEQATLSMCLNTYRQEALSPLQAQNQLREAIHTSISNYLLRFPTPTPSNILDVGCSVGVSTFALADKYPSATVTGLDLSPYFLAVAKYRQLELQGKVEDKEDIVEPCAGISFSSDISRVKWLHAVAEDTKLPSNSFDLISSSFVVHEMPEKISADIAVEMFRILKPGGVLAVTDINPRSSVIQNLPPIIATFMKSTEPFSDEYYAMDLEYILTAIGYKDVVTDEVTPRHRTILARKPYSLNELDSTLAQI
eukprot:gene2608-5099_t